MLESWPVSPSLNEQEPLSTDDPSRLPTIPRNQCSDGASITIIDGWDGASDCCQCKRRQWCVAEELRAFVSLSLSVSVFPSFSPSLYFFPYISFPLECEWSAFLIKVIRKPPHRHIRSLTRTSEETLGLHTAACSPEAAAVRFSVFKHSRTQTLHCHLLVV